MIPLYPLSGELYEHNIPKSIEEIIANELNQENDWDEISKNFKLTNEFLEIFKNQVNWYLITSNKSLTYELIDKFADYLDWNTITKFWQFSSKSLKNFSYYIDWNAYFEYYDLPGDFCIEM